MAMRCTQWPTSASGSGMYWERSPRLIGAPGFAAVVGSKGAGGRDGDEHAVGIGRIEEDGVQAHAAGSRLPARPRAVAPQAGELRPRLPTIGGAEQRGVLGAGIDGVGVGERRLEMPDPLELPRVRGAVVPLVRAGIAVVSELVADRRPGLAAVLGALDLLPEPTARLRTINPIRIGRRTLDVVNLPAGKVRTLDGPRLARAIGTQNKRPFTRSDQNPHTAHYLFLPAEGRPLGGHAQKPDDEVIHIVRRSAPRPADSKHRFHVDFLAQPTASGTRALTSPPGPMYKGPRSRNRTLSRRAAGSRIPAF